MRKGASGFRRRGTKKALKQLYREPSALTMPPGHDPVVGRVEQGETRHRLGGGLGDRNCRYALKG